MSIPDRLYNLAKGHLENALDRWNEIDAAAQQEIDSVLMSSSGSDSASAWDRAVGKINQASAAKELAPASQQFEPLPPDETDIEKLKAQLKARGEYPDKPGIANQVTPIEANTLLGAYKLLGIEAGSDWNTVRETYHKLKERAAPDRFPADSPEQKVATNIQNRIDAAFMILTNSLAPSSERFDRLEL